MEYTGKKPSFKDLLEQSQNLTSHIEGQDFLIYRNVEQIDDTARRLAAKSVPESASAKNKAHYLLAVKGFDADKLSRNLSAINLKTTYEPIEPLPETDIEGYLKHEYEFIHLTAIEEAKKMTISRFKDKYSSFIEDEWEKKKKEIMEVKFRGQKALVTQRDATRSPPPQFAIPMAPLGQDKGIKALPHARSVMDTKMMKYAAVCYALNEYRKKGKPFALVSAFFKAFSEIEERDPIRKQEISDSWELLKCIIGEENTLDGEFKRTVIREMEYYGDYLKDSKQLKQKFIRGAKQFLELQYSRVIRAQIRAKPTIAQIGSSPSLRAAVRGYLNIKYNQSPTEKSKQWPPELEVIDGYPIWAEIFYCIRCGDYDTALSIANQSASMPQSRLGSFPTYLQEYLKNYDDNRLPDQVWEALIHDYKVYVSRGVCDPYKLAVYNIIGKCDPTKSLPQIFTTTQDFIWLKLNLIRESDTPLPPSFSNYQYSLAKLQKMLVDYGPDHFNKSGKNPLLYFQVLLMSLQFEKAVHYLVTQETFQVEALHFALSLYYYGTLRQPNEVKDPSADQMQAFDFVRILRQYVGLFSVSEPVAALQYYCVIRAQAVNAEGRSIRNECLKDLLLETREFDILLPLLPDQSEVMQLAAAESEATGKFDDAVRLYKLAKVYDKVLGILNNQLSRVLTIRDVRNPERERMVNLARDIYNAHRQENFLAGVQDLNALLTFEKMLRLVYFFDLYLAKRYQEALMIMEELGILPFDMRSLEKKVVAFRSLDDCIKWIFGDVLLATMECMYNLFTNAKSVASTAFGDGGSRQKMQEMREKAKVLVMFSGMIQYRMPSDTQAKLMKMEVLMS